MAKRAKVTPGEDRKKNASPAKKKKKGVLADDMVGVITTTKLDADWKAAFKKGLKDSGFPDLKVEWKGTLNGSYHKKRLQKDVRDFNKRGECKLVVTVGGLVAYESANAILDANADKPFISLIGSNDPLEPTPRFWGGVSLESSAKNDARIIYLQGLGHAADKICLFQNLNSEMRTKEVMNWNGHKHVGHGGNNSNGENDNSDFSGDFARLPGDATAVVISADPYFLHTKDELIAAANNAKNAAGAFLHVCYPLQDYGNGNTTPTPGKATLYGPTLKEAYYKLGKKAGDAITAQASVGIEPADNHINPV